MRRALAVLICLPVLLWFFGSPFFHLHTAGAQDSHQGRGTGHDGDAVVHIHLPDRYVAGPGLHIVAGDEDEKPIDSFAVVQKYAPTLDLSTFVLVARLLAPEPASDPRDGAVATYTVRAHDPPDTASLAPRAPPV